MPSGADLWWPAAWGTAVVTGLRAAHASANNLDKDIDEVLSLCTCVPGVDRKLCQMKD